MYGMIKKSYLSQVNIRKSMKNIKKSRKTVISTLFWHAIILICSTSKYHNILSVTFFRLPNAIPAQFFLNAVLFLDFTTSGLDSQFILAPFHLPLHQLLSDLLTPEGFKITLFTAWAACLSWPSQGSFRCGEAAAPLWAPPGWPNISSYL